MILYVAPRPSEPFGPRVTSSSIGRSLRAAARGRTRRPSGYDGTSAAISSMESVRPSSSGLPQSVRRTESHHGDSSELTDGRPVREPGGRPVSLLAIIGQ